mmetsp:Transcript_23641/g.39023  ORF Transcript_23641/g.39023 Transcript_23641/m.39023 type:complete len:455 (+) Transcript_23641:46-1410(+)
MTITKVSLLPLAAVLLMMMGTARAFGTRTTCLVPSPISSAYHQGDVISAFVGGTFSQLRCYSKIKHIQPRTAVVSSSNLKMINKYNDEDLENESKIRQTQPSSAAAWDSPQSLVGSLLQKTTSRAFRTLADNSASYDGDTVQNPNLNDVIEATISRSSSTLDEKEEEIGSISQGKSKSSDDTEQLNNTKPITKHEDKRTYLGNPSVTPTALAHSLWKSTILPHQDTVIDATCGNGKDCLALAKMLFPVDDDVNCQQDAVSPQAQLIGIDIQARAIANTQRSLLSSLPSEIYYNHVSVLEQSHEHLMNVPADTRSVGLVCYNLGYLPGGTTDNYKETQTQTQTTLNSITDASLLLRVGGLLSVMTYPGSNLEESRAVEHFSEGLAMLTTRDVGGWRGYVDSIPDYDDGGSIRGTVSRALERVAAEGSKKQTWRVFLHKPLGRPLSPVLVTAMRIK